MKRLLSPLLIRRVRGASMTPTCKNGSIVIASSWRRVKKGQVVVARYGHSEVIKRVHTIEGTVAQLIGDNPSKHHSITVQRTDIVAVVISVQVLPTIVHGKLVKNTLFRYTVGENKHKNCSSMTQKQQKQSGFTIVELLIVIVIIAILAAIGFVSYKRIMDKGQAAATRNIVQQYSKVLGAYYADNGHYPDLSDLDPAEIAAIPEDHKSGGACLGTGYKDGCGSDFGKNSELQSFHNMLAEYVGKTPPNISPHDVPLVVDPGTGLAMHIVGITYFYFEDNGDPLPEDYSGPVLPFSMVLYALDEADAECTGGKTLGIKNLEGNFDSSKYFRNTLTDDENTACVVFLEE